MPRTTRSSQSLSQKQGRSQKSGNQSTRVQASASSQLSGEALEECVNRCVRYFIYRAGSNLPIRKSDLQKYVLQHVGKNYDKILTEVNNVLHKVYGYDLQVCEDLAKTKLYILKSHLPHVEGISEDDEEVPKDAHKILVLLVLTHIFMSNNPIGEASLFSFLNSLNIDVERKHSIFGNVKDFINSTMVKQKYLSVETDQISRKNTYSWGQRAENTVSKQEILKFVCKMYGDKQPRSWTAQFENAMLQSKSADETEEQNGVEAFDEDENY